MGLLIFCILVLYVAWRAGKAIGGSICKHFKIDSSDYEDPPEIHIHNHNHTHENHLHITKEDLKNVLNKKQD